MAAWGLEIKAGPEFVNFTIDLFSIPFVMQEVTGITRAFSVLE